MSQDFWLYLCCVGFGGLVGAIIGLASRFGFPPRVTNRLAAFTRTYLFQWWFHAICSAFFAVMALLESYQGLWFFAAFFVILAVASLIQMIGAFRRRSQEPKQVQPDAEMPGTDRSIAWIACAAIVSVVCLAVGLHGYFNAAAKRDNRLQLAQSGTQLEKTWVMMLLHNQRLVAAVWCDIDFSVPGSSAGTGNPDACKEPFGYFNSIRSGDGRAVEWCIETHDDEVTAVKINGREFNLRKGDLFLVRTRREGAPITQVNLDLRGNEPGRALWERLAKENTQVKQFIAEADAAH